MEPFDPTRPTPESITARITERFDGVVIGNAMQAWFFSLHESHWPNFATIVTTDEHDDASDLDRPGRFRLNIGVGRESFERIAAADPSPDPTAADRLFPHPVYGAQHWISIVNPSAATFETELLPLLDEAHARLAAQEAKRARP